VFEKTSAQSGIAPKTIRDRKAIAILAVIVLVVSVPIGYYLGNEISVTNSTNGCTCFSGNNYEPAAPNFGTSQINGTLANQTAASGPPPSNAQEFKQNNTIIFHSSNVSLLVFAYPNFEAGYLLNRSIPAYDCNSPCPSLSEPLEDVNSTSNSFTIYGLIQPTLIIPRDSTINVTFVNMDPTDHHSFVMSTFAPPYAEYIMQNMATQNGEMVQMTPLIPPINTTSGTVSVYQYTVLLDLPTNVTNMWYMCMFPMHANQGMWGNITLSPSSAGA
jgi:hypothetical protein